MKNILVTKDAYINNSVRVNYFQKDCIRKMKLPEFNQEKKKVQIIDREETYNKLLFCERLTWVENESELEGVIQDKKTQLESQ
jgi:hypothetical protein